MRSVSRSVLLSLCALSLAGCFEAHFGDDPRPSPVDPGSRDAGSRTPPDPTRPSVPPLRSELDLLFVVENAGSIGEEQAALTEELPRLLRILLTGDFDQDGDATGPDDFLPLRSVHFAVVTTDMGSNGFTMPTCSRSDFGDDGIFRTQGHEEIAGCAPVYPLFLRYDPGSSIEDFSRDAICLTTAGTDGCGFEQQLEAALKSLSPGTPTSYTADGYVPPVFFRDTLGYGDRNNAGFLRDSSLLAVVVFTMEDDCSVRDPDLFNISEGPYASTDLNLRCFVHEEAALHSISRYVDGLLGLRRDPSRLIFGVIAGIPADLVAPSGGAPNWEPLLSDDPTVRDPRMVAGVDPSGGPTLRTSCNVPGRGVAYPPVRILRVARELESRGAGVSVTSICQENYRGIVSEIVGRLGR